ncbi:MAG: diacylglycerol kinase family lipid kinase [Bacteroidetes bacterium]|nr:diacylglycerol kinase family lipid kinase [Bacteroidota bacterium]
MSRKWFLIINPASNRGQGTKAVSVIREWLARQEIEHEILVTTQSAEAMPYVMEKAFDHDLIIAAGGDGTVHEVINGMMQARENKDQSKTMACLGILPIGSGNDFVKMLNVPVSLPRALDILLKGQSMKMDVGRISVDGNHSRYFNNNIGIGFDAYVNYESIKIKRLRGVAIYLTAVVKSLFAYQHPTVSYTLNGNTVERKILMLTVGNGLCAGGGFYITPDARLDDGVFDICIVDSMSKPGMLRSLPRVMKGTHTFLKTVSMHKSDRIEIHSKEPLPIHADGEVVTLDAHSIQMDLVPSAIQVLHNLS